VGQFPTGEMGQNPTGVIIRKLIKARIAETR
jgi:hypothetical protein